MNRIRLSNLFSWCSTKSIRTSFHFLLGFVPGYLVGNPLAFGEVESPIYTTVTSIIFTDRAIEDIMGIRDSFYEYGGFDNLNYTPKNEKIERFSDIFLFSKNGVYIYIKSD